MMNQLSQVDLEQRLVNVKYYYYNECQEQRQTVLQDHSVQHCVLFTTWTLVSRYKDSRFVQRPWLVWMWFISDQ